MSVSGPGTSTSGATPFVEIGRSDWAALAPTTPMTLDESDVVRLRGLGDPLDLDEVRQVYVPLSRLLNLYASNARSLHRATSGFLGERAATTPFVIGVAGSVAVGKSTVSRLLRELLRRWEDTPRVELVTTDGFLLPNRELERRGLMQRKGFPESYDQRALLRFITNVKSGMPEVRAPFYSHLSYDIVPDAEIVVNAPDILIVEGLNVLQPPRGRSLAVSDMFDFSIFVDARTSDIERWYEERFLRLQKGAFTNPRSYFRRYADMSEAEARTRAREIWNTINGPNLLENVRPTRSRARLVLKKDHDHSVGEVLLRKI
ncbi:type I pantothenate kinase [Pseudoclavibacter chungangensis]|uniref:Pantothenate kinase n=1 Tax=Pseudoclavibacter chungangensis TaxID=587635 RepID=A0A7J5C3B6_9MICO|nr:type I pantothenate kinase [Pseudoclavibacter chungangensis]KAB1662327.1 type I pantothenate kinase [Pseudoclavibacter chungangensis]NYJ65536.1 type I pantothenate kinase [Pseudoclavibacter chungangensis]